MTTQTFDQLANLYDDYIMEIAGLQQERLGQSDLMADAEVAIERVKQTVLLHADGTNELQRKANAALDLQAHEGYQALQAAIKQAKSRMADLDITLESKRLRMRLLGWQMEWLVAQEKEQKA